MKLYETKKLHYGEFLYKLVIHNRFSSCFRTEFQKDGRLDYARQKIDELTKNYNPAKRVIEIKGWATYPPIEEVPAEHLWDAIDIYRYLKINKNYKIRCEIHSLIIYSNDRNMLIRLGNKLRSKYLEFWEPDPSNIETLLTNDNIIIVDKPPKYEYKITFGKKLGSPALAKWIENNPTLGKIGDATKEYCEKGSWVKGLYIFVKDKRALLMVQMIVGDNISRIDKLVCNAE